MNSDPILVTGMPRSGTTWFARLLAAAPGVALTGREPMNPRGRQYALAGTLPGWVRLTTPTPRQTRALRRSYQGRTPWVYSRYGHRQWAALLPGRRIVVKDPFALLSIPAVCRITMAHPVLLYRHPGAVLTSYRRMGWRPDEAELTPIIAGFHRERGPHPGVDLAPGGGSEAAVMSWFWNALYGMALADLDAGGVRPTILAHEDIASHGALFAAALFDHLRLPWQADAMAVLANRTPARVQEGALHNFDRAPAQVAHEWEHKLAPGEREELTERTAVVAAELRVRRFVPEGEAL